MRFRTILVVVALVAALGVPASAGGQGAADDGLVGEVAGFSETKLTASDAAADQSFGSSVAVSGDRVVVSGAGAYVFDPDGSGGYTETKLTSSAGDVAVSGDMVAVVDAGAVHVFEPDGGGYTETNTLTTAYPAAADSFGSSIAMDRDTIVVGAPFGSNDVGSAHVFEPDGNGGYTETRLTASDGEVGDEFGGHVAVSGDTIVVSAAGRSDWAGSVYVFEPNGAGSYAETELTASDAEPGDGLGTSVGVSGHTIVAGALGAERYYGAVYVFQADGTGGFVETVLTSQSGLGSYEWGWPVAVSGDTILAGESEGSASGQDSGIVEIFEPDRAGGYVETTLYPSDGAAWDSFGVALAIDEDTIVVGATGADGNKWGHSDYTGAVYVFEGTPDSAPPQTTITYPARHLRITAGESWQMVGHASDDRWVGSAVVAIRDRVKKMWWWGADQGFRPGWPEPAAITAERYGYPTRTAVDWVAQGDDIALPPGSYAAYARAFDTVGKRDPSPAWVPFTIVAPDLGVDIFEPTHKGVTPAGGVRFAGSATGNEVRRVRLGIRDRPTGRWLQNPDTGAFGPTFRLHTTELTYHAGGRYRANWDLTAVLPPGSYGVTVRAFDQHGSVAKTGIRFRTATNTPTVVDSAVTYPEHRSTLATGTQPTVAFGASGTAEATYGVRSVEVALVDRTTKLWLQIDHTWGPRFRTFTADNGHSGPVCALPCIEDWDWDDALYLEPGSYAISVRAYDKLGNLEPKPRPWVIFTVT